LYLFVLETPVDVYEVLCRTGETTEEIDEECEIHYRMRDLLKQGRFEEVCHLCRKKVETSPDIPAKLLLERLEIEQPTIHCIITEK
jgi:uncharacterized protein YqfB (UPF0267 family)